MTIGLTALRGQGLRLIGLLGLAAGIAATTASAQRARVDVAPYLEVNQVVTADFNEGDVLTYTSLVAGVDGRVTTRRVQAQISYSYQHNIAWGDDVIDSNSHNGVAQAHVVVVPRLLNFDAGAMAAQSQADFFGPIPDFAQFGGGDAAQIYSVYGGPSLTTRVGPVDVAANYQLAYVHVDGDGAGGAGSAGRFDSSVSHSATASVGMAPGELPIGWTVGAGYVREDTNRLDSTYEGRYIRGDVVVPISPHLAVTAGAGFEDIEQSQQDIQRNSQGLPIISPDGDVVADPSRPRVLAYDQSGLIWDAGVIWRPSRRTELQARVGHRYGGTTVTGSFSHRFNSAYAVSVSVYDTFDSFGRLLVRDVRGIPVSFSEARNPLNPVVGGFGSCVFGTNPGTGTCFDDSLQAINDANFRNRGANIIFSGNRGPWNFGVGASYSNRRYYSPQQDDVFTLDNITDQSFSLNAGVGRRLSPDSGFNVDAFTGWFDSGAAGAPSSWSAGVTGSYYQTLFDRFGAHASVGVYTTQAGEQDRTAASALIGLRYTF